MPKIQPQNDGTFLIDGFSVPRGAFMPKYNLAPNVQNSMVSFVSVGKDKNEILKKAPLSDWTDENDAGFATLADFDNYVKDFFGKPSSGGGGGAVDSVFGRTGNVVSQNGDYTTSQVTETTDKNYVTDSEKTTLSNTSGTNTGDETTSSIQSKRPLKTVDGQSLEGNGDIPINSGIPEAPTDDLYTRRSSGWELVKPAGESFRIGNVEGDSNFNNGTFWGVAILLPSGTYNQMAFQVNQFNPNVGQSWQARCEVYDPVTLDSAGGGVLQIDNTIVGDYPNIPLSSSFTLTRARYMYVVLGVNDNVGGGSFQGKRTTANSLNNNLISFSFNQASGALPTSLSGVTINAENNQWFQVWFYNV